MSAPSRGPAVMARIACGVQLCAQLGDISAISQRYLGDISAISPTRQVEYAHRLDIGAGALPRDGPAAARWYALGAARVSDKGVAWRRLGVLRLTGDGRSAEIASPPREIDRDRTCG